MSAMATKYWELVKIGAYIERFDDDVATKFGDIGKIGAHIEKFDENMATKIGDIAKIDARADLLADWPSHTKRAYEKISFFHTPFVDYSIFKTVLLSIIQALY